MSEHETKYAAVVSVFSQPEVAYDAMRDYALRCDGRTSGRCKSCGFLLKAVEEIRLLHSQIASLRTTLTVSGGADFQPEYVVTSSSSRSL